MQAQYFADLFIPDPDTLVTFERYTYRQVDWCRSDDIRMSDGLAPRHPELANFWPDIYKRMGK